MSNFRLKITPDTAFDVLKAYMNNDYAFHMVCSNVYGSEMTFAVEQDSSTQAVELVLCEDGTWHMAMPHFVEGHQQ
jgi:hypothetical protein